MRAVIVPFLLAISVTNVKAGQHSYTYTWRSHNGNNERWRLFWKPINQRHMQLLLPDLEERTTLESQLCGCKRVFRRRDLNKKKKTTNIVRACRLLRQPSWIGEGKGLWIRARMDLLLFGLAVCFVLLLLHLGFMLSLSLSLSLPLSTSANKWAKYFAKIGGSKSWRILPSFAEHGSTRYPKG